MKPEKLTLVEPHYTILPALLPKVEFYPKTLSEAGPIKSDVVVFKQSLHHLIDEMGQHVFDFLDADLFINLSMPLSCDWPMSPELNLFYEPSVSDVDAVIKQEGMRVVDRRLIDYPVTMKRDDWTSMIRQRFVSILHGCDDDFIAQEVQWIERNLPENLKFNDSLECLIFST